MRLYIHTDAKRILYVKGEIMNSDAEFTTLNAELEKLRVSCTEKR